MHPRYVSTSFVSFPFSLSLLSRSPQRELSRDTSRVGVHVLLPHTHIHGTDSPSGIPVKQTHTRLKGDGDAGIYGMCLEGTVVANYFVSPACWMASTNFNWIRTRAKKFTSSRRRRLTTTTTTTTTTLSNSKQSVSVDLKEKKKKNYTETIPIPAMAPRGNGFIPAVLMGFRVIPIHNTRQSIREHYLRA